jgi:peptidoglycan/xylan/chitin deacetylase (PgdA/CDA1 family)
MNQDVIAWAGKLVAPAGVLSILTFHQVKEERDPLQPDIPDAAMFDAIAKLLAKRFNVLPLADAVVRLKRGSLPPHAACITFDDGYANNLRVAVPVLLKHGLTATFFLCAGMLGGGIMWNDRLIEALRSTGVASLDLGTLGLGVHPLGTVEERKSAIDALIPRLKHMTSVQRAEMIDRIVDLAGARADLPSDLMMQPEDVRRLVEKGMSVGGHTMTHPILSRLDPPSAEREIVGCRERLGELAGVPICLFAYPNGKPREDYTQAHVHMVRKAGFTAAVTTSWGVSRERSDIFQLPRYTPWRAPGWAFVLQMYRNYSREPLIA